MSADPRPALRRFLARHAGDRAPRDDEDVFAGGYVNSLLALELVRFVERELGVAVRDEDLDLDNFRSIDAISAFVVRRSAP